MNNGIVVMFLFGLTVLKARTFTDVDGRKIEADFVSGNETEVVLKAGKAGRIYRLKIERLSKSDAEYVAQKVEEDRSAKVLVAFALEMKGKKVGDGECWTLADKAFTKAGIKRPGEDIRVWGRLVDWKKEEVRPGDILELRAAKFSNGIASGPEHTAVVIEAGRRKGVMAVYHQNWGAPGKKVSQATFNLEDLEEGEAMVYRYEKR